MHDLRGMLIHAHAMRVQDAAGLKGRPQGPVFGLTYNGRFSPWDLFMLRGSNGRRTSYNKCACS